MITLVSTLKDHCYIYRNLWKKLQSKNVENPLIKKKIEKLKTFYIIVAKGFIWDEEIGDFQTRNPILRCTTVTLLQKAERLGKRYLSEKSGNVPGVLRPAGANCPAPALLPPAARHLLPLVRGSITSVAVGKGRGGRKTWATEGYTECSYGLWGICCEKKCLQEAVCMASNCYFCATSGLQHLWEERRTTVVLKSAIRACHSKYWLFSSQYWWKDAKTSKTRRAQKYGRSIWLKY